MLVVVACVCAADVTMKRMVLAHVKCSKLMRRDKRESN